MNIVKIDVENNIYNIKINDTNIIKSLKKIDNNIIELLYEWNFESNIIECYGCLDSDSNIKNKHILPPYGISSNILYDKSDDCNIYGNIYIACKNNKYIDYYDYDYGMLYFNINSLDNDNDDDDNDNDNDDDDDDNDDDDDDDDDDENNLIQYKYTIKNKINIYMLDYDNNIY